MDHRLTFYTIGAHLDPGAFAVCGVQLFVSTACTQPPPSADSVGGARGITHHIQC